MITTAAHWRLIAGRLPHTDEGDSAYSRIIHDLGSRGAGEAVTVALDDAQRHLVQDTNSRITRQQHRATQRYSREVPR